MKPYKHFSTFATALLAIAAAFAPSSTEAVQPARVGIVSFKECVEHSKLGKVEQQAFNKMKKDAEDSLKGKEAELADLTSKLNDADYVDSLTASAEKELKDQYRMQSQDLARKQQAAYQMLTQANYLIAQKMTEEVTKASEVVAKQEGYDIILNQDACFYSSTNNNITGKVVDQMDSTYDKKDSK